MKGFLVCLFSFLFGPWKTESTEKVLLPFSFWLNDLKMQSTSLAVGVFWEMEQLVVFSMLVDIGSPSFLPRISCLSLKLHVIVLSNKAPAQTCLHFVEPRLRHQGSRLPFCGVPFTDSELLNMIRIRTERSFHQLDLVTNLDIQHTKDSFRYMCIQLRRGQDWI